MRAAILVALVAACAPATTLPAAHPARRDAPTGRLAGPPPALRAGAADDVPRLPREPTPPATPHHH
jgi:hypothetical protein